MQVDANSSKAINNNQVRIGGSPEIKTSLFAATPVEKRPDKRKKSGPVRWNYFSFSFCEIAPNALGRSKLER